MSKAKDRRGRKNKSYYERQFGVTERNKASRAAIRSRLLIKGRLKKARMLNQ